MPISSQRAKVKREHDALVFLYESKELIQIIDSINVVKKEFYYPRYIF